MTCQELTDFLADYLDGELPSAVRDAFDGHLAACSQCRNYLASYRATIRLGNAALRGSADDPVPAEVPDALLKAILAARTSSRA